MTYKNQIIKILEEVVGTKGPTVDFSANEQFGDYTTNIALQLKKTKKFTEDVVIKINGNTDLPFTSDCKSGFINFWLKKDVLIDNLIQIDNQKENFGKSDIGKGKTAIVEYSSPNIAKPFGVGHLRSTVIGDAIANLMEATGFKVMRDNHVGDWGTQFGKIICAIKLWGDEKELDKSDSPVEDLVKLYIKFHEASKVDPELEDSARGWFKKLEDGDSEARSLWKKCIDWSWTEFDKVYDLLGIKFDKGFSDGRGLGESFFETRMELVIDELEKNKLLKTGEDGAKLVFFKDDKFPPAMIIKKDGATLYATRDLATDKYRLDKYKPDLVINEVGSEQSLYFKQLYEIERLLGWYSEGQRVHVGHGLFLLDGKKMSTRAGKTVKLEKVLLEAVDRARKLGQNESNGSVYAESAAKQVGIGAIKYFDLSHHPLTNINFDWDNMFAMDGNSAPYIQYTVARINSVVAKSDVVKSNVVNNDLIEEELLLLRKLSQFTDIITSSAINYSPNILCSYLYELASKFNTFYSKCKIIDGENEAFRLILAKSTGQVLKNGLKLLGIDCPERM